MFKSFVTGNWATYCTCICVHVYGGLRGSEERILFRYIGDRRGSENEPNV